MEKVGIQKKKGNLIRQNIGKVEIQKRRKSKKKGMEKKEIKKVRNQKTRKSEKSMKLENVGNWNKQEIGKSQEIPKRRSYKKEGNP